MFISILSYNFRMLRTPSNLCLSSASFVKTFVRAASFQAQLAELNFVSGRRSKPNDAGNCEVIDSIEPRSGKTLGQFYLSGREEVSRAIDSAKIGLDIWRKFSDFDKSRIMQKAAGILRERKADIVYLDAIDTG